MTKCKKRNCHTKIWLLLLLNPSTQFLSIEILQNQSTAEVISGLIRHMSKFGSKDVFLSDNGSHFWPLRTKYATVPKTTQTPLPPLWHRLINEVKTLNAHGAHLWLMFSTGRHEALSRVEKMVQKVKQHLKRTQIFNQFLTPRYSCSEIETFLSSVLMTINSRPLCIYKNDIITPQTFYFHNYTMSPLTNGADSLINNTKKDLKDLEEQIKSVIKDQNDSTQLDDIRQFKQDLGIMAVQIDTIYQILAVNLLPSLLKAHDKSGNELNKMMFNSEQLRIFDCVFDPKTYEKTGNLRASLYTVMYISENHKSVLIAKPQTHILRKSKYPNSNIATTDRFYTQANLHLEYLSRDTRHINFICHGSDASDFVSFDPDWTPMKMTTLMEEVMKDDILAVQICTPVISSRDNVDLKSIFELIEKETTDKNHKEVADQIALNHTNDQIIEFPHQSKFR